jgi:hypothetical protein
VDVHGLTQRSGEIIERGRQFKAGDAPRVEPGHVAINMFFENSTRTMTSFQLGCEQVIVVVVGGVTYDGNLGANGVDGAHRVVEALPLGDAGVARIEVEDRSSMVGMDLVNTLVSACWTS